MKLLDTNETIAMIKAVRELVKENPNNTYYSSGGRCYYTKGTCKNGSVGCLFGQALRKIGKDDNDLNSIEYISIGDLILCSVPYNIRNWCSSVQASQDTNHTWGEAVKCADKEFSLEGII